MVLSFFWLLFFGNFNCRWMGIIIDADHYSSSLSFIKKNAGKPEYQHPCHLNEKQRCGRAYDKLH